MPKTGAVQMFDPYTILGVPRTATSDAIKAAYRQSARRTHPDRGGAPEAFIVVVRAFGVLSDPDARRLFDETGLVDEDAARNQRNAVALILADMFDAAVTTALGLSLPLERVDFILQMASALRAQSAQAEERIGALDREIEALKALRGRIRRGDTHPNLFVERLDAQVLAKLKEHEAAKRRLLLLEAAAAELSNYDSEVELFSALEAEGAAADTRSG